MNDAMPRRRPTYAGALLATLGLLALTTSASAECAWVLWSSDQTMRHNEMTAKKWEALDATDTYLACQAKARKAVQVSVDLAKSLEALDVQRSDAAHRVGETLVVDHPDERRGAAV